MEHHHFFSAIIKIAFFSSLLILIYVLFSRWIKYRERSWAFILKQDNNKALAPLRISAYERIIVMLERISPQNLVMRYNSSTSSAAFLQMEMIKALREEFDHNVSLQMYVSVDCWEKVKKARDESRELIKMAFTRVRPESTALELSGEILKLESTVGTSAIREAIMAIRMDMAKHY
jgi:uncharacterized protein YggT (Ycf19 family)